MDISTSTNIVAFTPTRERLSSDFSIAECAKAGYRVLDYNFCECMNPHSRMRDDDWETYVKGIAAQAKELGIEFRQSHLPYYDLFAEKDEDKKRVMEELIRRSIIGSAMLGVRWTVTHPSTVYEAGQDMRVSRERNLEYYDRHVRTARENGLGICLENDFEYRPGQPCQRIYCASVYELCDLVDAFRDPEHVGVCYDFGHANLTGERFHRKNLNVIGSRLHAIHVQDNHGKADEHLMPFFGSIDWKEAMAGLADIGYDGDLTFEIQEWGRYLPKEHKHLICEDSIRIGTILVGYFEDAKAGRPL